MKLGELFYEIGFHADTMKLNDFVRSVGELNMSSILSGISLAGLWETTKNLLEGTVGLSTDMRKFGIETGLSEQRMNSWSQAAEDLGIKSDVMANALRKTVDMQTMLRMHGQIDPGWVHAQAIMANYAGVKMYPGEDAFSQMIKVHQAYQLLNGDATKQRDLIKSLYGDTALMTLFKEGDKFWRDMERRPSLISKEDEERGQELQKEWTNVSREFQRAGISFAEEVMPVATELARFANSDVMRVLASTIRGAAFVAHTGAEHVQTWSDWVEKNITTPNLGYAATLESGYHSQQSVVNHLTVNTGPDDAHGTVLQFQKALQHVMNEVFHQNDRGY